MHSTILVISTADSAANLDSVSYDSDDIYESLSRENQSCDYVSEWDSDPASAIEDFLSDWEKDGIITRVGDRSFRFKKGAAEKYFEERYKELKEYVAKMSPEDFSKESTSYHIRMLCEERYGTYVYYAPYEQAVTLDYFVRGGIEAYDEDTVFVIETLYDYHE